MIDVNTLSSFTPTSDSIYINPARSHLLRPRTRSKVAHANELLDISTIALSNEPASWRAKEIIEIFQDIVPFAAAKISRFDPVQNRHSTMVNEGYEKNVSSFLDSDFVNRDELFKMMRHDNHGPLRWADTPFDYRRRESAQEVFIPAGYDEGFSACLFTPEGRYVGAFHTSVADRRILDSSVMEAIKWMQRLLVPLVDSLLPVFEVRRSLAPEASAFLITSTGKLILETAPPFAIEGVNFAMLAKAIYKNWQDEYQRGFAQRLWRTSVGELVSVQIICVSEGLLVALESATVPYSLSYRELEIITGVANGKTNIQIANKLRISPLTVAKHLENIREKSATSSRAELAIKASREGMLLLNP